jgi:hypothetical protein
MLESVYQRKLIKKLEKRFPGCVILKNDTDYLQGIPDLLFLWEEHWAILEVKASEDAEHQPNQDYYVHKLNRMSFSAFIYPENEEEILDAMESAFAPRRTTRVPQS